MAVGYRYPTPGFEHIDEAAREAVEEELFERNLSHLSAEHVGILTTATRLDVGIGDEDHHIKRHQIDRPDRVAGDRLKHLAGKLRGRAPATRKPQQVRAAAALQAQATRQLQCDSESARPASFFIGKHLIPIVEQAGSCGEICINLVGFRELSCRLCDAQRVPMALRRVLHTHSK